MFHGVSALLGLLGALGDGTPSVSAEAPCTALPLYENGRQAGMVCPDAADPGLYALDLGDRWVPRIFSETPDHPQPYREVFVGLANGQPGEGKGAASAQRDR